ncbi:WcaF family extracellular polysaccharide biosynthesis acetyltransferase [Elongatibacter sediminis]|uniref:WcaF family extracellular polysaccharide biosynthesis acetyltransferase n=1 Tax=Elongatibacter sediminis TaxID=3119006 RepID=A0AAW9R5J8_9GAMM
MRLDRFDNRAFDRGRPWLVEAMWRVFEGALVNSGLPGSGWRVALLRLFGARVGGGVVIKPYVRVKFPWKLHIGDHSWIGESVWIDNLESVAIGAHCCVSQGAYLCTGNHRWDDTSFALVTQPIIIGDQCWIGAQARVAPGVTCGEGAVLCLGGVATADLEAWTINAGIPATRVRLREKTGIVPEASPG